MKVVITCMEEPEAQVRLHECVAFDREITTLSAERRARGLAADQRALFDSR